MRPRSIQKADALLSMRVVNGSLDWAEPSLFFAAASAAAFSAARDAVCATKVEIGCEDGLARARGTAMSLMLAGYEGRRTADPAESRMSKRGVR